MHLFFSIVETGTAESVVIVENGIVEEEERAASAGGVVVFDTDTDKVELISAAVNEVAEVVSGTDKTGGGAESAEQSFRLVVCEAAVHLPSIHFHTVIVSEREIVAVDFGISFDAAVESAVPPAFNSIVPAVLVAADEVVVAQDD